MNEFMDELTNLQVEQLVPFVEYTYDPVEDHLIWKI